MVKAEVMIDGVGQLIMIVVQRMLPLTETCQRLVRVIDDLQSRLLHNAYTNTGRFLHMLPNRN